MNFYQLYDKINGKPYQTVPPPVKYNMKNYMDITKNSYNSAEENSEYNLIPLSYEDMARYADNDVVNWHLKHGQNNTKLGKEMTDDELKKFYGHTW